MIGATLLWVAILVRIVLPVLGDGSGRLSLHEDAVDVGIIRSVATIGLSARELALTRSVNKSSEIAAWHSGSWSKFPRVTAHIKT
jgi:hypothetical protein